MGYQIFTDATADLSSEMMNGLPNVEIIPMGVLVGSRCYTYGPDGDLTIDKFYEYQRGGLFASTTQINPETYVESFEPFLKRGIDVIYLSFSSGLSSTLYSAKLAVVELQERYPERIIECIDTLCASVGEGFLVHEAAKRQLDGLGILELKEWILSWRLNVCHWFTVDTFEHLKRGGRVSSVAAAMGNVLNIKPLLHLDETGALKVAAKPRGRKQAVKKQLEIMKEGWIPELSRLVVIGHGDNKEDAEQLKIEVQREFPGADIFIADIGPIIGAHTGPGMLALIYWGVTR